VTPLGAERPLFEWFKVGLSAYTAAGDEDVVPIYAHLLRAAALHTVLDDDDATSVEHWGGTDNTQPQRLVELLLTLHWRLLPPPDPAGSALDRALVEAGTHPALALAAARLVERLLEQQRLGRLGPVELHLPDGNRIRCADGAPVILEGAPSRRDGTGLGG
jgi:hypothetical protein